MAAEFKIGRLRFTWVGAWQPDTTYARDSVTQYQGKTYVCLVPNTSSSNFYSDLYATPYSYWNLVVDGRTFVGTWTPGTLYSLGNLVIFGGKVYSCVTAHTSVSFASDADNWTEYVEFTAWNPLWTTNTAYGLNDVVRWGGIVYICVANHTSAATLDLGLEANQSAWQVYYSGIDYRGMWVANHRYKVNDLVKLDADIFICTTYHDSTSTFDTTKWATWLPGFEYQGVWSSGSTYQPGDTTMYGGYVYVSNTENNINHDPSTDNTNWTLFNQGYEFRNAWNNGSTYKIGDVVSRDGIVYQATADSIGQDPSGYAISTTYNSTGSSGKTLVVASTAGITPGMYIHGIGFTAGQSVSSVSNSTTLILNASPDGVLSNLQSISFVGANSAYWQVLTPGTFWTKTWSSTTQYTTGDIVIYKNGTYVCIQGNLSIEPDNDTQNNYWVFYIPHSRKNSLTAYGDIESYLTTTTAGVTTGKYTNIPIGPSTYVLRNTGGVPTWTKINVRPAVYYVSTTTGQDIPSYGTTWDQPWKTIQYAAQFVGAGTQNPNAVALLKANKNWAIAEMYQWMVYQVNNNISPFSSSSVFDPTKTQRDAGYIIDALAYDLARGGNSQSVAAALAYFAFGSTNTFFDSAVASEINYFTASLNYLSSLLVGYVLTQSAPTNSYQVLNSVPLIVPQITNLPVSENNAGTSASTLLSIVTTALTTQSTLAIPTPNTGITASIFVKTGTYAETLPIVVPENTAIIGDELRGVIVEPKTSIITTCTATTPNASTPLTGAGLFTVTSTAGLTDQMPIQFADPVIGTSIVYSPFGGVTAGQTYYVVGSSITSTQFSVALNPTVTFTGSIILGSPTVSGLASVIGLSIGCTVTGTGIAANTTIISVGTNSITLSFNATVTANNLVFVSTGASLPLTAYSGGNMTVYAGDCLKDMFRLRNGTGLRNMTLTGLLGTLILPDGFTVQRPSGGSYACLDAGLGPNDTSAWIFRRSPYVQNVTAFGNGCTALKIDGSLHNGGNKSIVCNDFTHIVNDGIGIWCTGAGALTEAVSVFSYYGYAGYFAEAGGRIRATNGNTSYGQYGVIAEGFDPTETPATGNIFNQSSQVQATVQQAYGSNSQLLRIEYQNAGSGYNTSTTNLLNYSNNFLGASWTSDSNVAFNKINIAPTGNTEAWTLVGATAGPDGSYVYQNVSIPPTGQTFTNVTATNVPPNTGGTGSNSPATFNITVTSTSYIVTVNSPGGGYVVGNQLYIQGGSLGGVNNINDCVLTVTALTGNGIQNVSVSGVVPAGSANSYTLSLYVKQGTAPSIDIYGIFSGSNTLASGLNFNFNTGIATVNNTAITGTNSGFYPVNYAAVNQQISSTSPTAGWYRIWFAINDTSGLNNQIQLRIYPRGYSGTAGLYSYVYGAQIERSSIPTATLITWTANTSVTQGQYILNGNNGYLVTSAGTLSTTAPTFTSGTGSSTTYGANLSYAGSYAPSFYLENSTTGKYTAYANYNITGSGTGVVTIGDEVRSSSVFQTRVTTDTNGVTGGAGYLTASNNAQAGTSQYIQLSAADTNTNGNYTGMRVFINSGTGAGQYGYISYFNSTTKNAYVLKESFDTLQVTNTSSSGNVITLGASLTTNTLYINQPVQFIPTYYTTSISSTSLAQTIVTSAIGGTSNYFTVSSTTGMYVNMPITFTNGGGTIFSDVTAGYTYYIYSINPVINGVQTTNTIQITEQAYGVLWPLNTVTLGNMTANFSSGTSYIQGSTTNMVVNYPIQFTGTALGGLTVGTVYYILDVIDNSDFTIAGSLVTVTITSTSVDPTDTLNCVSTASLIPLNPIVFTNVSASENIVDSQKYYISNIVSSGSFNVTTSLITVTATATQANPINLITVASTAGFVPNQPIQFVGQAFGGIVAETVYYISVISGDGVTFTISQTPGGGAFPLTAATGSMTVRTCPTPFVLQGATGLSMVGTSTSSKTALSLGIGAMNGTFSTSLFGGVTIGQTYYINTINSGSRQITVSLTAGVGNIGSGSPITLVTKTGSMNLAAVGWDHLNIGTPILPVLDNTSVYFIEPRTVYTTPTFSQTVVATPYQLASNTYYTSIAYGNGLWVAVPSGNSTGAYSTDGQTWSNISLPSSGNWTGIAYGNTYWVVISSAGTGSNSIAAVSKANGAGWRTTTLPGTPTTWSNLVYGNGTFVAIATGTTSAAYSTNYGQSWSSATLPTTAPWTGLAYGNGKYIAVASSSGTATASTTLASGGSVGTNTFVVSSATNIAAGQIVTGIGIPAGTYVSSSYTSGTTITLVNLAGNAQNFVATGTGTYNFYTPGGTVAALSTNGTTWTSSTLPTSAVWSSIAYGNNMFVAVSATSNTSAYTFDGITWYSSNLSVAADKLTYGQGVFVAVSSASTTAYTTEGGIGWTQRTVSNDGYGSICFGFTATSYNGVFVTLSGRTTGSNIFAGAKTKGRAQVTSGTISAVTEWEPGSNYSATPTVTFTDPNVTTLALVSARTSNGVLSSPTFFNKGTGYNTASTSVILSGNGYADQYQTGLTIIMNNLTRLPSPGDNLTITGISQIYKVTSAYGVYSTVAPYLEANVSLSPSVSTANATSTGTSVSIRSKYSQARLTNHDFLNIGYGDQAESNYPGFPESGYASTPNAQVVEVNYGRVFFTSTDQDGNFKVGNLFGVQQATGIVTLSASQFGLTGLSSLSLGGISVGGSSVQITQFSTDGSFTANSDSILPTQRAIKTYLTSRLSQGGANTFTGQLTAGTVVVGGSNYIRSTLSNGTTGAFIKMPNKVYINANGVDGNMAALDFFMRNSTRRS
jgi:hypothetical protein